MIQALIGQKIDQTQKFLENGKRIPVTEVSIADNVVVQVKTLETDKYIAVQLGWGKKKKPFQAAVGHVKKAKLTDVPSIIREVRFEDTANLPEVGDMIAVETVFKPGDIIQVSGISKGKGFASAIKRYNFRGGPKTHGQSDRHRAPGSIGQGTTPGRVYKGKKMAGRMGTENVTIKNLVVVDVDAANKKLYVMGLIPGHKMANVVVTVTGEMKKFVPLLSLKVEEPVVEQEVATEAPVAQEEVKDVQAAVEPVEAPAKQDVQADAVPAKQDASVEEEKTAEEKEEKAS
jgi:large subunit ribosomal protein L3